MSLHVFVCACVRACVRVRLCVQLEEGKLWFQLACSLGTAAAADGADMLGISGRRINDGSWHTVALELNRNFSSLALDDSYVERRHGLPFVRPLALDRTIYFGALVSEEESRCMSLLCCSSSVVKFLGSVYCLKKQTNKQKACRHDAGLKTRTLKDVSVTCSKDT